MPRAARRVLRSVNQSHHGVTRALPSAPVASSRCWPLAAVFLEYAGRVLPRLVGVCREAVEVWNMWSGWQRGARAERGTVFRWVSEDVRRYTGARSGLDLMENEAIIAM